MGNFIALEIRVVTSLLRAERVVELYFSALGLQLMNFILLGQSFTFNLQFHVFPFVGSALLVQHSYNSAGLNLPRGIYQISYGATLGQVECGNSLRYYFGIELAY